MITTWMRGPGREALLATALAALTMASLARAQETTGAGSGTGQTLAGQIADTATSVAGAVGTTLPVQLPTARVTVVLDGSDVRALASVARDLYAYAQTPQGHALIEALHSGGNSDAIADRFMDGFDRFVSLRYPTEPAPAGPAPLVQIPVELHIWYHGPTLEMVVKEVIDEIFVSRPWTRIGARFPRISRRIRERMVMRCNSLYNRIVWRKLRELHPRYLALVNGEIDKFTAKFKMDPKQVGIQRFASGQQGWAGLSLDGKQVFSRSSREIREAFRDVTQNLDKVIEDLGNKKPLAEIIQELGGKKQS